MSTEFAPYVAESVSLRSVTARLMRGAATIGTFGVLAAVAAVGYLALIPPRYEAQTEILLDPRRLQVVQNDVTPRSESNESAISLVESQLRVVQSEHVLRTVVERLRLDADPEFVGGGLVDDIRELFATGPGEHATVRALRRLQRVVIAQRASRSYVIVVNARSEDPLKAARIADTTANVYLETEVKARSDFAKRASGSMVSRLKELADAVRDAEARVEEFKKANNLTGAGNRLVSDQQLEEMNIRLITARNHTVEQRARLEQIERMVSSGGSPDAIAEAVQSTAIAQLRAQYADIVRREGSALALLGARHPDVQIAREQRKQQLVLIADELKRITEAARNDFARARASEEKLAVELEVLKRTAEVSRDSSVRLRELERQSEANRAIYEAFLVRAKELGEQGGVDTSSSRVIAEALAPNRPSTPRGSLIPVALAAGLMLGAASVLLRGRGRPAG
jgi:succinoglycan biosynthesis transport protein ExoP